MAKQRKKKRKIFCLNICYEYCNFRLVTLNTLWSTPKIKSNSLRLPTYSLSSVRIKSDLFVKTTKSTEQSYTNIFNSFVANKTFQTIEINQLENLFKQKEMPMFSNSMVKQFMLSFFLKLF